MNTKPWWQSKTIWFNILSAVVVVASGQAGIQIPANIATPIVIGGNLALRAITNQGVTATDQSAR